MTPFRTPQETIFLLPTSVYNHYIQPVCQNQNDKRNKPLRAFVVFVFRMYYRPLQPGSRNLVEGLTSHDDALH